MFQKGDFNQNNSYTIMAKILFFLNYNGEILKY